MILTKRVCGWSACMYAVPLLTMIMHPCLIVKGCLRAMPRL